eukprot:TRINITY_DN92_c1_g2_i1.p1 TRINITY_DN92_c1_g2~~TRINITY_DN92_c1_g2_i1.p1  ORF type:complete len:1498 (+),score=413.44 TRINITY_DN92_c1_g2_i1:406-4494(+)
MSIPARTASSVLREDSDQSAETPHSKYPRRSSTVVSMPPSLARAGSILSCRPRLDKVSVLSPSRLSRAKTGPFQLSPKTSPIRALPRGPRSPNQGARSPVASPHNGPLAHLQRALSVHSLQPPAGLDRDRSAETLQEVLPGMRVVAIDGQAVEEAADIGRLLQGLQHTVVLQHDDEAPLLSLLRAGMSGCGQLSPTSPVTLPMEDRRAAQIPESADRYAMSYPIEGLLELSEEELGQLDTDDPVVAFAILGGFLHVDENGVVCGANALTQGETMHFDGPFPWRQEYTEQLRADGRITPVTLRFLRDLGARFFAYLIPNETLGGVNGRPPWRISRHGGFVYLMDECAPGPKRRGTNAAGGSVSRPSTSCPDIFFVMLAGDTGARVDSWEQIRVCPHCRAQQREDLAVQEVVGAMRCDNCGQLSPLQEKIVDSERQDLIKHLCMLAGYFVVLASYIVLGASILREVELPHEREARQEAWREHNKTLSQAAVNISRLANASTAGVTPEEIEAELVDLVGMLQAGDPTWLVPCTPTRTLQWGSYWSALFWVYGMVTTIPEVLPITSAGRVVFVFYVVGGLICVLNVIFDLAYVIPSVCRAVFRLFRKRTNSLTATQRQLMQERSEDLFEIVDYDGSGTLTLWEFREFLALYEENAVPSPPGKEKAPFPENVAQELLVAVDKGKGELDREGVRQAIMMWERMKKDAAQMPGSYVVIGAGFGNIAWMFSCALLFSHTEGFAFSDSLWLCAITLTTMGFGPYIPQTSDGQVVAYWYVLVGLGSLAWLFAAIGNRGKAAGVEMARNLLGRIKAFFPWAATETLAVWQRVQPPVRFYSPIDEFGEFSPEYPTHLEMEGHHYPSVLHFITAARFRGTRFDKKLQLQDNTKTLDRLMELILSSGATSRKDWEATRDDVMLTALCNRTQIREVRDMLLSTGDRPLIYDVSDASAEGSAAFELAHWGTDGESGSNRLGELLVMLRSDFRNGIKTDLRPGVCSQQPIHFFGYLNPHYAMFNPSFPCSFVDREGQTWRTVDHFFQARKFVSEEHREKIRDARTPHEALTLGRARDVPGGIAPDWDVERVRCMNEGLILKFAQNPRARQMLLQTGNRELVFDDASDSFWGAKKTADGSPGANVLGRSLMALREKLRSGVTPMQLLLANDQMKIDLTALGCRASGIKDPLSASVSLSVSMSNAPRKSTVAARRKSRRQSVKPPGPSLAASVISDGFEDISAEGSPRSTGPLTSPNRSRSSAGPPRESRYSPEPEGRGAATESPSRGGSGEALCSRSSAGATSPTAGNRWTPLAPALGDAAADPEGGAVNGLHVPLSGVGTPGALSPDKGIEIPRFVSTVLSSPAVSDPLSDLAHRPAPV